MPNMTLRVSAELHDALASRARAEHRSMNAQAEVLLRDALGVGEECPHLDGAHPVEECACPECRDEALSRA